MSGAAVVLDGITKRYGEFVAVDALSLEIPAGVIYGVLGPNGAGKTTTLRMLNDILAPDEGSIRLFGDVAPGRKAAPRIGYLPEERGLYPKMKVVDVLAFFGQLRQLSRKEARRRARQWLERLGLSDWATNKVQDLSKGMQQKVQFAAALLHEPDLLILDEPWSGLDPINAEVLKDVVLEQRDAGKTILFSTHLMEQAEKICDAVCIIARGKKVVEGDLAQLKRDAAGDRLVALAFQSEEARDRVRTDVLADQELVAQVRERRGYLEVELCPGQDPSQLLARVSGPDLRRFELVEPTLHQIFVDRVGEGATSGQDGRTAS